MKAGVKNCSSGRSFTLVELLVVIAIIAILAGMLLPALNKARTRAQTISCTNKLKQVGIQCNMYMNDFDGFMPGGRNAGGSPYPWYWAMAKYIISPDPSAAGTAVWKNPILLCPQNKTNINASYGPSVGSYTGFGMCAGGIKSSGASPAKLCKNTQIKNPSVIPYFGETNQTSGNYYGSDPSIWPPAVDNFYGIYINIHENSKSNILFVDGHVKTISSKEWSISGPGSLDPWAYHMSIEYKAKPNW